MPTATRGFNLHCTVLPQLIKRDLARHHYGAHMPPNSKSFNIATQASNTEHFKRLPSPSDLSAGSPLAHYKSSTELQGSQSRRPSINAPDRHETSIRSLSLDESPHAPWRKNLSVSSTPDDPEDIIESMEDVKSFEVPTVFIKQGMLLLKVSHKSKKRIQLKVDPASFKIIFSQVSKNKTYEFLVDEIRSFYARENANHYREEYGISKEFEKRWLTVIYYDISKNKLKTLNLIADTSHDLKKLLFVITNFKRLKDEISRNFLVNLKDLDEISRNVVFGKAEAIDKNVKEMLSFADVLKFCKRLNINLNTAHIRKLFLNVYTEEKDGIDFHQFKDFVKLLKERPELTRIWKELQHDKELMTFEDFKSFMTQVQKESIDDDQLTRIFKRFCVPGMKGWTKEVWNNFLLSKFSAHLKEEFTSAEYFSHSLNEYFILSSHNTYLVGRQFAGESSVEGYVRALQRGCRCVEIDIWDNEDDHMGDPVVNHGRTFSNGISLTNALRTIKKYAFFTTSYPLILSLEVHCSAQAQIRIIDSLKQAFGEQLVDFPIDYEGQLPSPEALKYRVLVKVKRTNPISNFGVDDNGKFVSSSTTGTSFSESNDSVSNPKKSSLKIRRPTSSKVIDALSELGVYIQGLKFRNFSLPESKTYNHCFSLSEKAINSMLKDDQKLLAVDKHNRKYLMRIYPSKFRLKSSNFVPINYWAKGCQMVATNWQTYDLGQQLNESFFEKSQGRGFVLKPLKLRRPLMKSTMRKVSVSRCFGTRFAVDVISAQHLPKPVNSVAINPFVIFEILGTLSVDWDKESTVGSTNLVAENGFNPVWNQRFSGTFESDNEMVFIRLTLHTSGSSKAIEDAREIGISVVNLFDLKQGYRYLPLKDICGEELLYSTLFLRVKYGPT